VRYLRHISGIAIVAVACALAGCQSTPFAAYDTGGRAQLPAGAVGVLKTFTVSDPVLLVVSVDGVAVPDGANKFSCAMLPGGHIIVFSASIVKVIDGYYTKVSGGQRTCSLFVEAGHTYKAAVANRFWGLADDWSLDVTDVTTGRMLISEGQPVLNAK